MVKKMRNTIIRHYSAAKAAKNSSRLALFVGLAIWGAAAHATPIQRSFEGELVGPEVFNYVWNAHIAEPSENASGKTPIKDSMQSVGAGYAGPACRGKHVVQLTKPTLRLRQVENMSIRSMARNTIR